MGIASRLAICLVGLVCLVQGTAEAQGISSTVIEDSVAMEEDQYILNHARQIKQLPQGPSTEVLCDINQIDCEFNTAIGGLQLGKGNTKNNIMSTPVSEFGQELDVNDYDQVDDDLPSFAGNAIPQTEACEDQIPPGVLDCNFYVENQRCSEIVSLGFCALSCGECILQSQDNDEGKVVEECVDVALPGTSCDAVLQNNLCTNENIIAQGYCLVTCDACGNSSPPPTFGMNTPPPPTPPIDTRLSNVELDCVDIPIPGTIDCSQVVANGLCANNQVTSQGYCQRSCSACDASVDTGLLPPPVLDDFLSPPPPPLDVGGEGDCVDVIIPGMLDCTGIVENGLCSSPQVVNDGYCQLSCDACPSTQTIGDAPPPLSVSSSSPPPLVPPVLDSLPPPPLLFTPPPPVLDSLPPPSPLFTPPSPALNSLPPPLLLVEPPPPPTPTTSEECVDVVLPGVEDCIGILDGGLCSADYIVDGGFCQKTCNLCGISTGSTTVPSASPPQSECVDVLLPGVSSCDLVLDTGLCSQEEVIGSGFCLATCDACPSDEVDCTVADALECDVSGLQALIPDLTATDLCTEVSGITCGTNGRVTAISIGKIFHTQTSDEVGWSIQENMDFLDLSGQNFPPELSKLVYLNTLEVEGTGLIGSIPPELSVLTALRIFDVDGDGLTGTLPIQFSTWTELQWFDASNQSFTGSLPSSYSEWSAIELIDLSDTGVSGALPQEWSEMDKLKYLYLYNSAPLTGSVPSEWTTFIDSVVDLNLGSQPELCIGALQQIQLSSISASISNLSVC